MSFYEPLGEGRFASTPHTRGPWDPAHQHAGPPSALLGRALERFEPRPELLLARLTFEILRPVPVAELRVAARVVRPGGLVLVLVGEVCGGGAPVMTVRGGGVRATGAPTVPDEPPPPPRPADAAPPPAGLDGFGYGEAVELRFAAGGWGERGPATVWTRLRVPVVSGEEPTGLQRVLAVADSGNGVSAVLSWDEWLFINPELTVHMRRQPRGEWICLDARTAIARGGAGLASSVLSDDDGVVGHGAQSLLVAPR
jgi:hypothetical protein